DGDPLPRLDQQGDVAQDRAGGVVAEGRAAHVDAAAQAAGQLHPAGRRRRGVHDVAQAFQVRHRGVQLLDGGEQRPQRGQRGTGQRGEGEQLTELRRAGQLVGDDEQQPDAQGGLRGGGERLDSGEEQVTAPGGREFAAVAGPPAADGGLLRPAGDHGLHSAEALYQGVLRHRLGGQRFVHALDARPAGQQRDERLQGRDGGRGERDRRGGGREQEEVSQAGEAVDAEREGPLREQVAQRGGGGETRDQGAGPALAAGP